MYRVELWKRKMIVFIKSLAPLFLYVAFIVAFFLSLAGRTKYGLLFIIPLLPLQNILQKLHPFPFGTDLDDILLLTVFLGWIFSNLAARDRLMTKSPFNLIIFLYFIFTYASLWLGSFYLEAPAPINPADPRVQNWKNYMLLPFLFFLTANNLKDVKEMKQLLVVMLASLALIDFYCIKQIADMTTWFSRAKINGTFVYLGANEVAAFHATNTLILLGLLLSEKRRLYQILLLLLIICGFYIVIFMFSRGAYLAIIAGLIFLSLLRAKKLLIPIVLALIFWNVLAPQTVIQRITFTEQEGSLDESALKRLILWEQSLQYFQQNPIMGIGFNVFAHVGLKADTHNVFLRTLAEQGLIGITFLLTFMLLAIRRGWLLFRQAEDPFLKGLGSGFAACTVAVMVGNFFGDRWSHLAQAAYFWAFLGLVERGNFISSQIKIKQASLKGGKDIVGLHDRKKRK